LIPVTRVTRPTAGITGCIAAKVPGRVGRTRDRHGSRSALQGLARTRPARSANWAIRPSRVVDPGRAGRGTPAQRKEGRAPRFSTDHRILSEGAPRVHENAKRDDLRLPATAENRHGYAETGINRPPPHFNGKEGVDGSSPSEGLFVGLAFRARGNGCDGPAGTRVVPIALGRRRPGEGESQFAGSRGPGFAGIRRRRISRGDSSPGSDVVTIADPCSWRTDPGTESDPRRLR
jgi:hypothetical protein